MDVNKLGNVWSRHEQNHQWPMSLSADAEDRWPVTLSVGGHARSAGENIGLCQSQPAALIARISALGFHFRLHWRGGHVG